MGFILNDTTFRLVPVPVTYEGGASTAGTRWTAEPQAPNDSQRQYAMVGMGGNHAKCRANSIKLLSGGDGNVIRGQPFILDAIAQASVTGWQPFPGPIPLPGYPGMTFAPLQVAPNSKMQLEGTLTVPGAGNQLSSSGDTADLFIVLIDVDVLKRQREQLMQRARAIAGAVKGAGFDQLQLPEGADWPMRQEFMQMILPSRIRPNFLNMPATYAAATATGLVQAITSSIYSGPISYWRQAYYRTNIQSGSEAILSMTQTHRVNWSPAGRNAQVVPWSGQVPAVLLGGTEGSIIAGMPPAVLQMDMNNGEQMKVSYTDTATGTASDSVRVDQLLMGFEIVPENQSV